MKTRKSIVRALGSMVILCSVLTGGGLSWLWLTSQPVSDGIVQGASTVASSQPALPQLQLYPEKLTQPVPVYAKEYALYHAESGKFIAESAEMKQVPIASTTKLMTAYLVSQNLDPETKVTVSSKAASQIGSRMGLYTGEKVTVRDLMYGLMLVSGNDAAYALAEAVGTKLGSQADPVPRFVSLMNETARELNLKNTKYSDPAGLNDEGYSTASDLAKLTSIVLAEPQARQAMETSDITVTSTDSRYRHDLHNSNRLLFDMPYPGIIGGKTGFTPTAGHCLTAAAKRDGKTLVAVVLNTFEDSKNASAIEARKLLEMGFANTTWR